ncbi:MAG: hypothetical protein LBI87_03605 [Candidatus Accumulibacter sp.]|jgi:hypothetical protein|nr:hypothetical protein [Accumulibacter sp.]
MNTAQIRHFESVWLGRGESQCLRLPCFQSRRGEFHGDEWHPPAVSRHSRLSVQPLALEFALLTPTHAPDFHVRGNDDILEGDRLRDSPNPREAPRIKPPS